MRFMIALQFVVIVVLGVAAQSPKPAGGPMFEVVAIRRNISHDAPRIDWRPDGGVTIVNMDVRQLVWLGYPAAGADTVGMPPWAADELYDVTATAAQPNASLEDRRAMMRSMLEDRFGLIAHYEPSEKVSYDLILASNDGRLGPSMKSIDADCDAVAAQQMALANRPFPVRGALCNVFVAHNRIEGDLTMKKLAFLIRGTAGGRPIIDKTGLTGSYRIALELDLLGFIRTAPSPGNPPSVFAALQEQLGLKLEPSRALIDVLVIDRLQRPTAN